MQSYALAFLRFLFFSVVVVHGAEDQKSTMLELAKEVPPLKWNTSNGNPCEWKRVTCSSSSSTTHVTGLHLSHLGLSTATSPRFFKQLCQISSLLFLDLSFNSFTSIPSSFFHCKGLSKLKHLNLSFNGLAGPLRKFSGFSNLEKLDLSFNSLQGGVSSQLNGLAQLKSLSICSNFFNGKVPVLKTKSLDELNLSNNSFLGKIPNLYATFKNLRLLDLSRNSLTGQIPSWIGNLSKLEILLLSSNGLDGTIPVGLSKLKRLSTFAANLNRIHGAIPPGITSHMRFLDLSYNELQGQIPRDLLEPETLQTVDLTHNFLIGLIPRNLSKNLYRLRLGANKLTGSIPAEVGKLFNLTYLELNHNDLEGEIPQSLGNCKSLTMLYLANNKLQGDLPRVLGKLDMLVVMNLHGNNLSGAIPSEFSNLENLISLNLGRNSLNGTIPHELSNMRNLQFFSIEDNMVTGSVPDSLSDFQYIIGLDLGHNMLSGVIPKMPISLSLALNLSYNLFNGTIPSQLGELSQLEILDLSNNNLSGNVPDSFASLVSLTELVLSNNPNLSGSMHPLNKKTMVDTNGTGILVVNGTGILGPSASAQGNFHKKRKPNTSFVVISVVVGIIGGFALVAAFVGLQVSKRFYKDDCRVLQSEEGHLPHIVNGYLIASDGIHRASIDFAKAMEAIGNQNSIFIKTIFSTYYKVTMPNGKSYTIKKLNWSERIFQKCSNEKLGQELEVIGRLSSSNIMVPLAYMFAEGNAYLFYDHIHKGTLFDFLHRSSENSLNWPSRYSIALGVAQGLTFLHSYSPPILLLDLSTNTILLKSMKEPQIGDVELCKVIDPSRSTSSLSIIAGSVGYIPPEYAYTMKLTMAGNVYSFGVLLLELLTGKPAVSEGIELAKWALSHSRPDEKDKILDRKLSSSSLAVCSQMHSVMKIALSCVNSSPIERPKTREVLRMLFNAK